MRKLIQFIITLLCFVSFALAEDLNQIKNFRLSDSDSKLRFVVDMSSKSEYKIYQLGSPDRVVIDITNSTFSKNLPKFKENNLVNSVRHYKTDSKARIVLDLKYKPHQIDDFILDPSVNNKNYRVVVDVYQQETEKKAELKAELKENQSDKLIDEKDSISKSDSKAKNSQKNITEANMAGEAEQAVNKITVKLKQDYFPDEEYKVQVNLKTNIQTKPKLPNTRDIKEITPNAKPNNIDDIFEDIDKIITVKLKETAQLQIDQSRSNVTDAQPSQSINGSNIKETFPEPVAILRIPTPVFRPRYKPMIVIDAGHGGRDPGAIGVGKSYEKNITLAYAKELKKQLEQSSKYEVLMIREKDVYLRLKDRVNKARSVAGDLFISLHVNAHKKSSTRGFSIYTLSETASDKEAAALARKENKAGLINGINLNDETDELTGLLIDMTQRQTKNISAIFAETIVDIMGKDVKLLERPHRFAGFRVLTGADIPSVLIELGYLTNKKEEKLLNLPWYKKKLTRAIVKSIDIHFSN